MFWGGAKRQRLKICATEIDLDKDEAEALAADKWMDFDADHQRSHTVVATDKVGNKTEYKFTVHKQYTVIFMVDGEVLTTKTANHNADAEMPEVPTKDGYTVTWKKVLDTMTGDVTVKAVYSEIPEIETSNSPQTGETTNLWLWVALLFVSGGCLFGTIEYQTQPPDKKHKLRALNLDKTGWALSFEICSLIYPFNPIVFVLLATAKARRLDVQGGGKTPYGVG